MENFSSLLHFSKLVHFPASNKPRFHISQPLSDTLFLRHFVLGLIISSLYGWHSYSQNPLHFCSHENSPRSELHRYIMALFVYWLECVLWLVFSFFSIFSLFFFQTAFTLKIIRTTYFPTTLLPCRIHKMPLHYLHARNSVLSPSSLSPCKFRKIEFLPIGVATSAVRSKWVWNGESFIL